MAKEEKKDDFEQATKVLKRVLPMMVQNHIPARPDHYSVWYSYVAKNNFDRIFDSWRNTNFSKALPRLA